MAVLHGNPISDGGCKGRLLLEAKREKERQVEILLQEKNVKKVNIM